MRFLSCVGAFIIIWEKRGHTPKQYRVQWSFIMLTVLRSIQYSPDSVKSTVIKNDDLPYFWAEKGTSWYSVRQ